jgi:glycolate oxidase
VIEQTGAAPIARELVSIAGAHNVLTSDEDLTAYGFDGTWFASKPRIVVLPETAAQVSAIHALASRERIPITPRAMSSGLSGGAVPLENSIVLAMTRMNRIVEIDRANQLAVVEPGVITADLQAAVEARGLFYPPDPSSLKQSAIGGNISENAGGARCLKYGVTSDYVLGLEVVLPDGEIIRTGGKTVKNVTGYDLRSLFCGAEGTLGTITQATLRLIPKPAIALTATATFDSIQAAARCVIAVVEAGLTPTAIEIIDRLTMQCVEAFRPGSLPAHSDAMLLFGVDGNHAEVLRSDLEAIAAIARECGATEVTTADDAAAAAKLWDARRAISPALAQRRPHKLGEDVAVPRTELVALVTGIREIAARNNLAIPIYGHAGDGNLHPNILCDRRNGEELARVRIAAREIFELAIALGGTLSGEHGIGLLKKQFMELDIGPGALALMRRIKGAIDPLNLMNPGKIFPDPGGPDAFDLR